MITSFRHDKRKVQKRRKFIATFFILTVIIFLVRGPLEHLFSTFFQTLGRPIWVLRDSLETKAKYVRTIFESKVQLEAENSLLRTAIDRMSLESYTREMLRAENEDLKRALGRKSEYTLTLTRVLAAPPTSPYDTLVVDAGRDHGVLPGMDAFIDGDFKVGVVSRVFRRSSVITLYSSPDNELSVQIGSSSIPALAHGRGGGNLAITLPRGVPVSKGDLVEIPALAPEYAGVVEAILAPSGTSLQTLFIRLPVNLHELQWIYLAAARADEPFTVSTH